MNMEKSERHTVVREGYQILLRAEAICLRFSDQPVMQAFYERLSDTCMQWAQSVYGERLRREFLALDSTREKSQFGTQHYFLQMRCVWERDGLAAILCESKLTGQWKEPQKSYHRISHVWNTAEETLLPFDEILRSVGFHLPREKLPFRPDGIYPDGEHIVCFRNVTDQTPFLEKKIPLDTNVT